MAESIDFSRKGQIALRNLPPMAPPPPPPPPAPAPKVVK
jgi:hypothetical protein